MKCTNCGREFEGTFCPDCGTKAATQERCPVCGKEHAADEQFCPNCGYNFTGASAQMNKERRKRPLKPDLLLPLTSIPLTIAGWAGALCFFFFLAIARSPLVVSDIVITFLFAIAVVALAAAFSYVYWMDAFGGGLFKLRGLQKKGSKSASPKDFLRKHLIYFAIMEVCFAVVAVWFSFTEDKFSIRNAGSHTAYGIGVAVLLIIPVISLILYLVWWKKHEKQINIAYYGENADKNTPSSVTYAQIADELIRYSAAWVDYWGGVFHRNPKTTEAEQTKKRSPYKGSLWGGIVRLIALALTITLVVLCLRGNGLYVERNIFHIEKIDVIDLGDTHEVVEHVLFAPYSRDADSLTWTYYDDNFKKLLEQNDNFDPSDIQDWNDFEDAFNDAAALETTSFSYIEVHFTREEPNSGDYLVSSIFFDPSRRYRNANYTHSLESCEAIGVSVDEETGSVTVSYSAVYTDGSFYKGTAAGTVGDDAEILPGRTVTLSWRDYFGNECTANYTVPQLSVSNT